MKPHKLLAAAEADRVEVAEPDEPALGSPEPRRTPKARRSSVFAKVRRGPCDVDEYTCNT
jgi:hypothetical protein